MFTYTFQLLRKYPYTYAACLLQYIHLHTINRHSHNHISLLISTYIQIHAYNWGHALTYTYTHKHPHICKFLCIYTIKFIYNHIDIYMISFNRIRDLKKWNFLFEKMLILSRMVSSKSWHSDPPWFRSHVGATHVLHAHVYLCDIFGGFDMKQGAREDGWCMVWRFYSDDDHDDGSHALWKRQYIGPPKGYWKECGYEWPL